MADACNTCGTVACADAGPKTGAANAGRPTDAWPQALRELADCPAVFAHFRSVLEEGTGHPFFWCAIEYATEHGYGRPVQTLAATVDMWSLAVAIQLGCARLAAGK